MPGALAGMRALGIEGLSVTMPHKTATAACVDRLTADAAALGAVNTRVPRRRPAGRRQHRRRRLPRLAARATRASTWRACAVSSSAPAARPEPWCGPWPPPAPTEVVVHNRDPRRGAAAAALAGGGGRSADAQDWRRADLVVQATPLGMGDDPTVAFDPERLGPEAVVVDLVYHPEVTPLLRGGVGSWPAHRRWVGHARPPGRPPVPKVDGHRGTDRRHASRGSRRRELTPPATIPRSPTDRLRSCRYVLAATLASPLGGIGRGPVGDPGDVQPAGCAPVVGQHEEDGPAHPRG